MNTNKTLKGLILLVATIVGLNAQAGVLVEPYLGLGFGGNGHQKSGTVRTDFEYGVSPVAGLRAGYSLWDINLGLDASYQLATLSGQRLSGTSIIPSADEDVNKHQVGVFLGYNLPVPMRIWATYYFMGEISYDNDSKFTSGSGYAFGASYTGYPLVAINLEYRLVKYDESESAAGVTSAADARLGEMLLSVSIPLNFELF